MTRFTSAASAWSARPGDPQDVFFAQLVETRDEPKAGELALFGVPYDGAVLGRPGARGGPAAIRAEMARLKPWTLEGGALAPAVRDWGDVRVPNGEVRAAHEAIEAAALEVLAAEATPIALGGDHSVTFPLLKAHEGRRTRIGVINLDAHLDVRTHAGQPNSGTSFRRLMDLGLVKPKNLVEMGIRDFANSNAYAEGARKEGVTILGAKTWRDDPDAALEQAIARASDGTDGVYLSLDVDVLDQAHAPGVSAPTPDGVDTATLCHAVRRIARSVSLVGADVVEVAPALDRDGMTARAAAYATMHLLAGLRERR